MRISRQNYEPFFIDYLEGKLSEDDQQSLRVFLQAHPDLAEEFSLLNTLETGKLFEQPSLSQGFNFLKKPSSYVISEEDMVAAIEGDLNSNAQQQFNRDLAAYPNNKVVFDLFLQTKLKPETIVFGGKASLKRPVALVIPLYTKWLAVAAAVLLFGFIGYLIAPMNRPQTTEVALVESPQVLVRPETKNSQTGQIKPIEKVAMVPVENEITKSAVSANRLVVAVVILEHKSAATLAVKPQELAEPKLQAASLIAVLAGDVVKANPVFLTPAAYVMQRLKNEIMKESVGISFHEEVDEAKQIKRYGFISKHFAYERIIQTN